MKQTAVEWLHEKMIVGKFTGKDTIDFLFETAKEIEKDQMIEFAKYTSVIDTEKTDMKKVIDFYLTLNREEFVEDKSE